MSERLTPWYFARASALARLDNDEDLLQDVIEQFLSDVPTALAAIERAIVDGDGPGLRQAAHSLKGAAGYLAADEMCALAQQLEGFGCSGQMAQARLAWPALAAIAEEVVEALSRELDPPPAAA